MRYEAPESERAYEPPEEADYQEDVTPASPPPPSDTEPPEGGHFADGAWQGGHRSKETGRRKVSVGVIIALITVVVVVAGIILWRFLGDTLSHRSDAAASSCVGSDEPVAVMVDPSIADQITVLADRYNKSGNKVGDHCVKITVRAGDSSQVVDGFIGNWPADLGPRPALWIPASSVSTSRLRAAMGNKSINDSRSLVTSPVVIAIRPQLKTALEQQNWSTLPGMQANPVSLEAMNMPGWGSLRLALPTKGGSDASYLAAEAVATASSPQGAPPTAGIGAVNTLFGAQPKLANSEASTAMDALLASGDPAASRVHAVAITEQQLYQRASKISDAKNIVSSWLPPGPVAVADYPTVVMSGSWLSEEQATAATEFANFLRKPDQLADLASAGFRAGGKSTPKNDVTAFPELSSTLSVGDAATRATLADAVAAPTNGPAALIMLDQSMPTDDGGKTRLANVIAALKNRIQTLPPTSVIGFWTFDGVEGRTEVPGGPLADQVNGQPRAAALGAALDKQFSSNGGAVSFTTLRLIYDSALASFRPAMKNSVLVITAGPHTDRSLDGAGLQDHVRRTFDPNRPVAINVIDFGADPDRATWESVAQSTGGGYQNLPTSATPDLATAVATLLG